MFNRFTESAIRVMLLAQEEAKLLGHDYFDVEIILLGLIGEGTSSASKCLRSEGASLHKARAAVESKLGRGNRRFPWYLAFFHAFQEAPIRPRAKRAFELAWNEAQRLKNIMVGPDHILLGLIRESEESQQDGLGRGAYELVMEALEVDQQSLERKLLESMSFFEAGGEKLPE